MGFRRYAARVDLNQAPIVEALRMAGRGVISLSLLGRGIPDLLVSNSKDMWLIELKNPEYIAKKSKRVQDSLNSAQRQFHRAWIGKPVITAATLQDILEISR